MNTEAEEQAMVVQYCQLKRYKFWHTPNKCVTIKIWKQLDQNVE